MQKFKLFLSLVLSVVLFSVSTVSVAVSQPFENNSFSPEKLGDYYTLINGCSQSALKNFDEGEEIEAVVYSGLDIKKPLTVFYVMLFYVTNRVDFDKLTSDPVYSTGIVTDLDDYLKNRGVKNEKSQEFLSEYYDEIKATVKLRFDTVGGFTFTAKKETVEKMLADECTDFVIAGSVFMLSQGDLNSDGKKNGKDVLIIQNVLAENYSYANSDEQTFIQYSADTNSDSVIDIDDATQLQLSM